MTHGDQQQADDLWLGTLTSGEPETGERPVAPPDGTQPRRSGEVCKSLLSRRISFAGADGWRIEGLFSPPLHAEAGNGLPPLVLLVHGGPTSAFRDGWLDSTTIAPQLVGLCGGAYQPTRQHGTGYGLCRRRAGRYGRQRFRGLDARRRLRYRARPGRRQTRWQLPAGATAASWPPGP